MHPALRVFEQISAIPRGSFNEKAISDWLLDQAKKRGYEVVQDDVMNILIRIPASPGCESAPTVVLQGHMDMVCVKADDSNHDFLKDPITLVYEEDIVRADGTTLGADDGFAIAYGFALMDSDQPHPPLELLITVEEEVSLRGASAFDYSLLKGRMLINLDSEGEGVICAGSAGGLTIDHNLPIQWQAAPAGAAFTLTVDGLAGGHSGIEIHKEHGNAIRLLCRVIGQLRNAMPVAVTEISGGSKGNAIPVSASATIVAASPHEAQNLCATWDSILKAEYYSSDPSVRVRLEPLAQKPKQTFDDATLDKLLAAVALTPCGPDRRDLALDIVINSSNMAILRTENDAVIIQNSLRSSSPTLMRKNADDIEMVAKLLSMTTRHYNTYPGWDYNPKSPLREIAVKSWEKITGSPATTNVIHAGLECGYFVENVSGMDAISIGPNILGAHTPLERMSLSSFNRVYEHLLQMLADIAKMR